MYIPPAFRVDDRRTLLNLIERHPFATLVTVGADGPMTTALPLVPTEREETPVLVGHVARANPHWQRFDGLCTALAIFHGPNAYVSPSWYAVSPSVPTWNYVVVHARGRPRLVEGEKERAAALRELVRRFESGRPSAWQFEALSEEYVQKMLSGIVAFELPVESLVGKFKLSQNRSPEDRARVELALREEGYPDAAEVADWMRRLTHAGPADWG